MTNLKRIRMAQGYSMRALAEKIGCTPPAVQTWEHGRCWPQPRHAKRLSDVLGMPVDVLLAPVNDQDRHSARSDGLDSVSVQEPGEGSETRKKSGFDV